MADTNLALPRCVFVSVCWPRWKTGGDRKHWLGSWPPGGSEDSFPCAARDRGSPEPSIGIKVSKRLFFFLLQLQFFLDIDYSCLSTLLGLKLSFLPGSLLKDLRVVTSSWWYCRYFCFPHTLTFTAISQEASHHVLLDSPDLVENALVDWVIQRSHNWIGFKQSMFLNIQRQKSSFHSMDLCPWMHALKDS